MNDQEKQLGGNITALTAVARVMPGMYPAVLLKKFVDDKREWLTMAEVPGQVPAITWLNYLVKKKDLANQISWLEHLRIILDWAQKARSKDIRKMQTIHYARWVILDQDTLPGLDGPHLLFASNFDENLDGYLMEFAEIDEGPLNLIFHHCVGWRGARPANRFIKYVRDHQIPAHLFYANYPRATVGAVNRALDWKSKTDAFIEQIIPALTEPLSNDWQTIVHQYLEELASPTYKDREYPTNDEPGAGVE